VVEATASGVVSIDGRILLVRHTYGVAKGRILLPGGHVKPGEMAEEAVSREILEETGVLARPLGLIGTRIKKDIMPLSRELCRAVWRETVIEFPYNPELKFQGIPDAEYMIYGF